MNHRIDTYHKCTCGFLTMDGNEALKHKKNNIPKSEDVIIYECLNLTDYFVIDSLIWVCDGFDYYPLKLRSTDNLHQKNQPQNGQSLTMSEFMQKLKEHTTKSEDGKA